jgi:hypothetical protein
MSEEEELYLKEISKTKTLLWYEGNGLYKKVTAIGKRKDEFALCAGFVDGTYAAMDSALFEDFYVLEEVPNF